MFAGVGSRSALPATVNGKNALDVVVVAPVRIQFDTRLFSSVAKVTPCFSFSNNAGVYFLESGEAPDEEKTSLVGPVRFGGGCRIMEK
jgi:hypothetical protein